MSVRRDVMPPGRARGRTIVVGVIAIAALIGAVVWVWGPASAASPPRTTTHDLVAGTVELSVDIGDVELVAGGDDRVEIVSRLTWFRTDLEPIESRHGDTLRIEQPDCGAICRIDYTVRIPAGTAVVVTVGTGDVVSTGVTGDQRLRTGLGDVIVRDASGTVDVHGDVGDVAVDCATPPDEVTAETSLGDVTVTVPADAGGYRVAADTGMGDTLIDVETSTSDDRSIEAHGSVGDVTVARR